MLTGEQLGRAIKQAMQLKGVTPTKMAKHFSVKAPSVYGWIKEGRISKEKLPSLWSYFSDVVGPTHWGLEAWPSGGIPAPLLKVRTSQRLIMLHQQQLARRLTYSCFPHDSGR